MPLFQVEEWSTSLTRVGSPATVSTHWWQWSPGLRSRLTSALPLTSPLCVALPSSFLNDCGLRFVPLIRQVAPEKKKPNKKKKHNKTHCFFLLPSLQIIFKHLWLWQQQINKHSAAAPLSEPISLWLSLPQQFLSSLDTKTPAGERRSQQVATTGVQRLQVLK